MNEHTEYMKEAEEKERKEIQSRVDALMKYNYPMPYLEVAAMTDTEWGLKYIEVQDAFKLEQERKEQEAEALRIENERRV